MPRSAWSSKSQQRQIDTIHNNLAHVIKVGRIADVPVANFAAQSDLKTRGAAISFKAFSLEGIESFVLLRNFSADPGSAEAIHTWPANSLKSTPQTFPIALKYTDADSAITGHKAYYWIKTVPLSDKTQGNVPLSGPQLFDASDMPVAKAIAGDFATYQAYTPTTSPLTAATGGPANSATITVAAFQIQYPFDINSDGAADLISYNGGTITPLLDNTQYFVYFDDSTYAGGTQTFIATTDETDPVKSLHRQYVGTITTPAHGGGGTGGTGGGNGPCFSGNTLLITRDGLKPIADILPKVDEVLTQRGWRVVEKLLIHEHGGPMCDMGAEEFVTLGHRMFCRRSWVRAEYVFLEREQLLFTGYVYNLAIRGDGSDEEQCYVLANGWIAHNQQKR